MGIVSPVGSTLDDAWRNVYEGNSGIVVVEDFDTSTYPTRIAGLVQGFDVDAYLAKKDQRKNDPFIHYSVGASVDAIRDSGIEITEENGHRIGVALGAGIGGIQTIEDNLKKMFEGGVRKVSPFFIPGSIINMASGQVSILQHITGPNISIVTACATSTHCIGLAARSIEHGDADVMLAGGGEHSTSPLAMAGFCAARAMSTRNDDPKAASRPYDIDRDGFVMSNGAGTVVLEEYEHAKARGAKIYAELIGFGMSSDACGWRRRAQVHDGGDPGRRYRPVGYRLYQYTRNLDPGGRHWRDERHQTSVRRSCQEGDDQFDQVDDRPPARSGRRCGSNFLRAGLKEPGYPTRSATWITRPMLRVMPRCERFFPTRSGLAAQTEA
jgi:3-oxoacyl-[acyl-carrier-protein] synthase II